MWLLQKLKLHLWSVLMAHATPLLDQETVESQSLTILFYPQGRASTTHTDKKVWFPFHYKIYVLFVYEEIKA